MINNYILSNFDYCPAVSSISAARSLLKVENLLKQMLWFLHIFILLSLSRMGFTYTVIRKKVKEKITKIYY